MCTVSCVIIVRAVGEEENFVFIHCLPLVWRRALLRLHSWGSVRLIRVHVAPEPWTERGLSSAEGCPRLRLGSERWHIRNVCPFPPFEKNTLLIDIDKVLFFKGGKGQTFRNPAVFAGEARFCAARKNEKMRRAKRAMWSGDSHRTLSEISRALCKILIQRRRIQDKYDVRIL